MAFWNMYIPHAFSGRWVTWFIQSFFMYLIYFEWLLLSAVHPFGFECYLIASQPDSCVQNPVLIKTNLLIWQRWPQPWALDDSYDFYSLSLKKETAFDFNSAPFSPLLYQFIPFSTSSFANVRNGKTSLLSNLGRNLQCQCCVTVEKPLCLGSNTMVLPVITFAKSYFLQRRDWKIAFSRQLPILFIFPVRLWPPKI